MTLVRMRHSLSLKVRSYAASMTQRIIMPTACRQTHQIDRRKLLKLSGALATLLLTGLAAAGNMPTQFSVTHSPIPVEPVSEEMTGTIIKLVGVGRGGLNAVEYLIERGVQGVEFICIDSDAQALSRSTASKIIQLGRSGDGTGKSRDKEREAAEVAAGDIRAAIDGTHMLFITAGMDSGTGAGAAPVIARIAREMGILTVGLVTRPVERENGRPMSSLEAELVELRAHVDSLIVLHNDELQNVPGDDFTQAAAVEYTNDLLRIAVSSFADMINVQNYVGVDFEDVRTVMGQPGKAMIGIAQASGPDRARIAAEQALVCPLIKGIDLSGAQGVLLMFASATGSHTLGESKLAMNIIRAHASRHAHVIYGIISDDALGDEIRITVVATGVDSTTPKASSGNGNYIPSAWRQSTGRLVPTAAA